MENPEPELQPLLDKWQTILRLRDWVIRVKYERSFDLDGKEGRNSWSITNKTSVIRILHPCDYDPASIWPRDTEEVLVHELVHLHLAMVDETDQGLYGKCMEQAVECLAQALIFLDRR